MLILALDVVDHERALKVAKDTAEFVSAIKVNYPLVLTAGVDVISELSEIRPVIADFKIADIPYTSGLIAKIAFEKGVRAVIAHGFVGRDTLEEVRRVASDYDGEVYVVTELSSTGGKEFMSEHALEIAKLAENVGCDGLIAPATRPDRIRAVKSAAPSLKVLCPGVGAQGGSVEDVMKAGADAIIVGRAIYNSPEPRESARRYFEELRSVREKIGRKDGKAN
ncbi:MAG: orotidine-5'-phosphate decarboxylase [Archaeoglobi archaeon]|nr:orotidine-5'-phosphate decarboxylase [Archaeoglobi archaeon]